MVVEEIAALDGLLSGLLMVPREVGRGYYIKCIFPFRSVGAKNVAALVGRLPRILLSLGWWCSEGFAEETYSRVSLQLIKDNALERKRSSYSNHQVQHSLSPLILLLIASGNDQEFFLLLECWYFVKTTA